MRVYELAKELGIDEKELVAKIKNLGFPVSTYMSVIDPDSISRIREQLGCNWDHNSRMGTLANLFRQRYPSPRHRGTGGTGARLSSQPKADLRSMQPASFHPTNNSGGQDDDQGQDDRPSEDPSQFHTSPKPVPFSRSGSASPPTSRSDPAPSLLPARLLAKQLNLSMEEFRGIAWKSYGIKIKKPTTLVRADLADQIRNRDPLKRQQVVPGAEFSQVNESGPDSSHRKSISTGTESVEAPSSLGPIEIPSNTEPHEALGRAEPAKVPGSSGSMEASNSIEPVEASSCLVPITTSTSVERGEVSNSARPAESPKERDAGQPEQHLETADFATSGPVHLPRVFLSYSHDSPEHCERVLELAQRLRSEGLDARIDRFVLSPPEGWPRWCLNQLGEADAILAVCTVGYRERFQQEPAGQAARGVSWEAAAMLQELYKKSGRNDRIFPVKFRGERPDVVPDVLSSFTIYTLPDEHDRLLRALTRQPEVIPATIGQQPIFPPRPPFVVRSTGERPRLPRMPNLSGQRFAQPEAVRRLQGLFQARDDALVAGHSTDELDQQILEERRRLRSGPTLTPGDFLADGRFHLIEPVGRGGFAVVWLAEDRARTTQVAMKVLHGQFASDESRIERFFRGARKMASLHHRNIVRVLVPHGEDESHLFFVMEYLPGGDLNAAVRRKRIAPEQRIPIILAIGDALQYAHDRGLVHRDVKPENILLDEDGQPLLTDFDLVHADDTTGGTRTGMLGTFIWAAPELLENAKDADPRADLFSLAMTSIFVLQGERPTMDAIYSPDQFFERSVLPASIVAVLRRALTRERTQRTGTVSQFCAELKAAAGQVDHG